MTHLSPELDTLRSKIIRPYWVNQVKLIATFHIKCVKIHGKAKRHHLRIGQSKGWGLRDTGDQLNMSVFMVRQALALNRAIKKDPTLVMLSNKDQAWKIVNG